MYFGKILLSRRSVKNSNEQKIVLSKDIMYGT